MIKATWLFNGATEGADSVWGFSESWYTNLAGDALVTAMDLVSSRRSLILSSNTKIIGYRIGTTTGRSYVVRRERQSPTSNGVSNIPVDSALCQVGIAGTDNRKRFFFHDMPDGWVSGVEINPNRIPDVNLVVQTLAAAGFLVRYQSNIPAPVPILSIDTLGVVKTTLPITVAVNQSINILNCRDVTGRTVRGTYVVSAVANPNEFTLAHWTGQQVSRSGKVRLVNLVPGAALYLGDSDTVIRGGAKKVGRPFFQFRGRVPNRR
jgi:hypothetical protein